MNKDDLKIVTTRKKLLKWSFRITFKRGKEFCNRVVIGIEKEKYRINLDKPIYIGASILDLCKILMEDFNYSYIKNKNSDKAEMLLTDTGSHIYKTEAENVYEDFYKSYLLQ